VYVPDVLSKSWRKIMRASSCARAASVAAASKRAAPYAVDAALQPSGLKMRWPDGGYFASFAAGRTGRRTNSPPQFGQRPLSRRSAQSRQNVHSNEQMTASPESGGRSRSQHSQLGLSASMVASKRARRMFKDG
jgi:hypothetical protein